MTTIFVFGSNLAGRHGAGSARAAMHMYGAVMGQGEGLQGRSYAIPTKDTALRTLPLSEIMGHVARFLRFAANSPNDTFDVVAIGCGLAGYKPKQIAPMFACAPKNVTLPQEFIRWLNLYEIASELETRYKDAVAACTPLQSGGKYVHLMKLGQDTTTYGVRALFRYVEQLEQHIARLTPPK